MQAVIAPDVVDSSCESEDDEAPASGATEPGFPGIDDSPTLDQIVGSRPDADFIKQTLRAQVNHDTLFAYGLCKVCLQSDWCMLMSRL